MAPVLVTLANWDLERLDPKDADSFTEFKQLQVDLAIKKNKDPALIPEKSMITSWLAMNDGVFYPERVSSIPDKPDIDASSEKLTSDAEKKKADEEAKRLAAELEKKQKEDAGLKKSNDAESKVHDLDAEGALTSEEKEKKKQDEIMRLRALNIANELDANPVAKFKLSTQTEYKDGKDFGFKAATIKFRMAQEMHLPEFNKVLKPARASEIDFDKVHWDSEAGESILAVCWYVCLHGPVGVNKATRFGSLPGNNSIAGLFKKAEYPVAVTNSMWKKFCRKMVEHIDLSQDETKNCSMIKRFGEPWPLCDSALITQSEYKRAQQQESMRIHGEAIKEDMK